MLHSLATIGCLPVPSERIIMSFILEFFTALGLLENNLCNDIAENSMFTKARACRSRYIAERQVY